MEVHLSGEDARRLAVGDIQDTIVVPIRAARSLVGVVAGPQLARQRLLATVVRYGFDQQ